MSIETFNIAVNYTGAGEGDELPFTPHAIRTNTGGILYIEDKEGNQSTWTTFDGETILIRARRIGAGSTASGIVLLKDVQN